MGDPVLLMGIRSEPPLAMAAAALDRLGAPYRWFDQRACTETELAFAVAAGEVTGVLQSGGELLALEDFGGVYTRLMDHELLPELRELHPDDARVLHAERLHGAANAWLEVAPARVVNRSRDQLSNGSKPYQAQLIRRFFDVPRTLVTNVADSVHAFREQCGRVVYKSISGCRSVVREFDDGDLRRLDLLRSCPVQFQEHVEGIDVRVHTIGGDVAFATRIVSDASDYRYAGRLGASAARLRPHDLDDDDTATCLELAASLGLAFAGIDLRIAAEGRTYCFEVNPSPAYSYFEDQAGQPIAQALGRFLAGL